MPWMFSPAFQLTFSGPSLALTCLLTMFRSSCTSSSLFLFPGVGNTFSLTACDVYWNPFWSALNASLNENFMLCQISTLLTSLSDHSGARWMAECIFKIRNRLKTVRKPSAKGFTSSSDRNCELLQDSCKRGVQLDICGMGRMSHPVVRNFARVSRECDVTVTRYLHLRDQVWEESSGCHNCTTGLMPPPAAIKISAWICFQYQNPSAIKSGA